MDLGKKVKQGVEERPIVAPLFAPTPVKTEPVREPVPAAPERELVPVRRGSQ